MPMFDPNYINSIFADIYNKREGSQLDWKFDLAPKEPKEEPQSPEEKPA